MGWIGFVRSYARQNGQNWDHLDLGHQGRCLSEVGMWGLNRCPQGRRWMNLEEAVHGLRRQEEEVCPPPQGRSIVIRE